MTNTILVEVTLEQINCGVCGIIFGLDINHLRNLKVTGKWFYCPNGCHIHYNSDTEVDKLKRELENQRETTNWYKSRLGNVENSLRSTRGQVTKLKKRIANGVCPCCNRHFTNLERHMKGQHPDYIQRED